MWYLQSSGTKCKECECPQPSECQKRWKLENRQAGYDTIKGYREYGVCYNWHVTPQIRKVVTTPKEITKYNNNLAVQIRN